MRKRPTRLTMPMLRRMQALRSIGLSVEAIRRVIELDYGDAPCEATIRNYTERMAPGFTNVPGYAGVGHTPARTGEGFPRAAR